jgi:putative membrane protein
VISSPVTSAERQPEPAWDQFQRREGAVSKNKVLNEAVLAANAVRYKVLAVVAGSAATIIGIPFLPMIAPISAWYWKRYYSRLRVILTSRDLTVHRGVLVTEEKSIPLEKITDLAVFQGPIMRRLGLKGLRVETAGQMSGPGALVSVIGIEDTDAFRDQVLTQRDRITDADAGITATARPSSTPDPEITATLRSIDDTLRRIEQALTKQPDSRTG